MKRAAAISLFILFAAFSFAQNNGSEYSPVAVMNDCTVSGAGLAVSMIGFLPEISPGNDDLLAGAAHYPTFELIST